MKNELKYDFIASSKVIRYKLDPKAADILAILIYKHQYWAEQGELINHKGRNGFYISIDNIREETCFGKTVIQSSLIGLKKEGLIDSKRQGLNKPNIYFIDINNIENYIKNHEAEYHTWKKNIRANKAISPVNVRNTENQLSRSNNSSILEVVKSDTTKNKNTNNMNTKNFTNHINVEKEKELDDWCGYSIELEEKIDTLRNCNENIDKNQGIMDIYNFLRDMIPGFQGFKMSDEDKELINQTTTDGVCSLKIADKIISNARAISEGRKESRFGNLFVGINKMNEEYELKYG